MTLTKRSIALAVIATLALFGAGCGDDGESADAVDASGVWARTSPAGAETGAAYMVLTSESDDALVGAAVGSDIAGAAEIHETEMADDAEDPDMGDDMGDDMGGGMSMREVSSIELPAGEEVALEPGGYHVMLLELAAPLESGDTFPLTLELESGSSEEVQVEVRDDAP